MSKMEVGEKTQSALSKLPDDQQKKALLGMKQFYVDTTKYLIGHLPLDNKLLSPGGGGGGGVLPYMGYIGMCRGIGYAF